ncbi:hypothetical protein EVAR_32604_1 [Eumeta japonica]|uniref:Uncharacterized protein n=1 Tax=Eumeta variegata TaxID=151549 RepID=A0A4C1WJ46_EUMVA|nr:hypothetical protein EVAR_32604_1 [Eumeta japonica]
MIRGHDKWNKKVTRWYPREGKRKRGRPQKRWDDDIRRVAGAMWNRVAQIDQSGKALDLQFVLLGKTWNSKTPHQEIGNNDITLNAVCIGEVVGRSQTLVYKHSAQLAGVFTQSLHCLSQMCEERGGNGYDSKIFATVLFGKKSVPDNLIDDQYNNCKSKLSIVVGFALISRKTAPAHPAEGVGSRLAAGGRIVGTPQHYAETLLCTLPGGDSASVPNYAHLR